jgi:hypothetical protein
MIFVIDEKVWVEYQAAKKAHREFVDKTRPHSHYGMSMEKLATIDRLRAATVALLAALRGPTTADRPALFDAADAVRSREPTRGPKPRPKDPLSDQ